jgi:hypothetical protein
MLAHSSEPHGVQVPPNTRMQRTRSSPLALRSPLMRCPLGDVWGKMRAPIALFRPGARSLSCEREVVLFTPEEFGVGLGVGR